MVHPDDRPSTVLNVSGGPRISFHWDQPKVSVDTGARYVDHQTIGDKTVRQFLGKDPDKIEIRGSCTLPEANAIDDIVNGQSATLISHRWSGKAQVDSTSTDPAGQWRKDIPEEWIYTYVINLTAVDHPLSTPGGMQGGGGGGSGGGGGGGVSGIPGGGFQR